MQREIPSHPERLDLYSVTAQIDRKDPQLSSLLVELGEKHTGVDMKTFLLPAVRLLYEIYKEGGAEITNP